VISARITSVVDGDTIKVKASGAQRAFYTVRLIGIDTPETHRPGVPVECGGKRASASMLRLAFTAPADTDGDGLEDAEGGQGRRVTLTTDPTQDRFDRYGRLLAYVKTRSGKLLQTEQLSRGLAMTYVYGGKPFQRVARFRAAEARGRAAKRGVWGLCGANFHSAA
jgi:micrococcal nuclease